MDGPIIIGVVLAFGVFLITWIYYRKLTIDIIKIQIAEELDWFYDPDSDTDKWQRLREKFPEIFSKGGKKPDIEDQFWGKIKKGKEIDFYSGILHFTTESKRSTITAGGAKATETTQHAHHRHFFSFKLDTTLTSRLYIEPYPVSNKQLKSDPGSISFSDAFKFDFKGDAGEEAKTLAKSLSGEVQHKLLELRKDAGDFWILFSGNAVFFMIRGSLFKKIHSSLFKNVKIDPRDKEYLLGRLSALFDITEDIVKHL
jgi:hypothetical protein